MRLQNNLVAAYSDATFLTDNKGSFYDRKDICLVDLCLHFLFNHLRDEKISIIPALLKGHLRNKLPIESRSSLFTVRQFASAFTSKLVWRAALEKHKSHIGAAYEVINDKSAKRSGAGICVMETLSTAMNAQAPYKQRKESPAKKGQAKFRDRRLGKDFQVQLPEPLLSLRDKAKLNRREKNPPIKIHLDVLIKIATQVDKRENDPSFPQWLPKLNLESRLKEIRLKPTNSEFYKDGELTFNGTIHVVGMLSSGKSSLVQALVFAMVSPEINKRVLVITKDTAAATEWIARLRAHGIQNSTVISSARNRDEHISAALWNTQSYSSEQALDAAAALTESLGSTCPLDGYQPADHSFSREGADKPCFTLIQHAEGKRLKSDDKQELLDCPLISNCPTHKQQSLLSSSSVIAMTPHAFVKMSPSKYALSEELSFPEAMQYLADIVLIDEADDVQRTFDDLCIQKEPLMSSGGTSFISKTLMALGNTTTNKGGGQFAKDHNVKWQQEFLNLYAAVPIIYNLFLKFQVELKWVESQTTFTSTSILESLWRKGLGYEAVLFEGMTLDESRQKAIEQLTDLSGALYESLRKPTPRATVEGRIKSIAADKKIGDAFVFLANMQSDILQITMPIEKDKLFQKIKSALTDGELQILSDDAGPNVNKKTKIPSDPSSRTFAVILALLTNHCLSTYTYLVRNQITVEDDFGLEANGIFSEARRLIGYYGSIIPNPILGAAFGLVFERAAESSDGGGTLRLVNHLAIGRYLITHLDKLLLDEGQAGPHVLLLSGTSWAGGRTANASPVFDVQWPVSAILEQPLKERDALESSQCEFVSLGQTAISVSGQPLHIRRENLAKIAELLGNTSFGLSKIEAKWQQLIETDKDGMGKYKERKRALLVTNNFEDTKVVANSIYTACKGKHDVYCLVADKLVRSGEAEKDGHRSGIDFKPGVKLIPRSQAEKFGETINGSILVAPLHAISRGHNIVIPGSRYAAIGTIYFLHRPHPRPDSLDGVVGAINRFCMDFLINSDQLKDKDISATNTWFRQTAKRTVNEAFGLRGAYGQMSDSARIQYSWDLITSIWQTIGRGIRGGVPIYVGFVDERFAPGIYKTPHIPDTVYSSCLKQCEKTLQDAMENSSEEHEISKTLYQPFLDMLSKLNDKSSVI